VSLGTRLQDIARMECLRQGLHSTEECPFCEVSVAALRRLAAELASGTSARNSGICSSALEFPGSGSGPVAICHSGISDSQAPPPESTSKRVLDSEIAEVLHRLANSIQVLDFHIAPLLEGRKDTLIIEEQIRRITQSVHQLTRALNTRRRNIA
jgi:hypothetical protein